MSFTVREYRDLLQLLAEHPEWREELRRALLSDDFLALPQIVRELAEAQKRTEENLALLTKRVDDLAKRVDELAKRVDDLAKRVDELAEAQKRTEETLAALIRRVDDTDRRLTNMEQRLAKVDGRTLEIEYERKATGYFGQILRRPQVVNLGDLEDRVVSYLSKEEMKDLWHIDLLVQGILRQPLRGEEKPEAYLAIEISVLVDREDVERAKRRADLLRKAGLLVLPVAAGEDLTERSMQWAEKEGVILVKDGSVRFIEQAIQRITQQ